MPTREFDQDFRQLLEGDLYLFSKYGLEYNQESYLELGFHYLISLFLSVDTHTRKQLELPRAFLKTTLAVEDNATWKAVNKPDYVRALFRCDVVDNAMKSIAKVKSYFESSEMLHRLWSNVVPNFGKVRWSDKCAEVRRKHKWPEGTFQAAGRGTKLVHQHFTHYFEDDLLVPKKDDLTGEEMIPSRDDVRKAIGAHKLAEPLLVNPTCEIVNVQNRWSEWDLVRHIMDNEPWFLRYHKACVKEPDNWPNSEPTYPLRFSTEILKGVEMRAGSYVFSTQYLGKPYDVEKMVFRLEWLQIYKEAPENLSVYLLTDAALGESKRADYSVAMVMGLTPDRHFYILDYIRGHLDPTDFINHIRGLNYRWHPIAIGVEKFALDKTIGHFLGKYPELNVVPVGRNKGESKDWHIRALIPVARDGRLHIRDDMNEFRTEYVEYRGEDSRNDLLDAAADIFKLGSFPEDEKAPKERGMFQLETILEELRGRRGGRLPFDYQLSPDFEEEYIEEEVF